MRWWSFASAPFLAVALLSTSASAQPAAQDKATAKQLTADAEKAMGDKRWMDAVSAFRKASKLDPSPARDVGLGQALAAAGKLLDARKVLAPVAEGSDGGTPAKKAREAAKKALADVTARIAGVKVTIKGPPDGQGKTVIDGIEVANAGEIALNPGTHRVGATADGFEDTEREVRFAEGAHLDVELSLTSKAPPPAAAPSADAANDKPHGSRAPGAMTMLLGGGGLLMGTILAVMSKKDGNAAQAQCTGTRCPAAATLAITQASTVGQASSVALVVGSALTVTGLVLTIVAPGAPVSDDAPAKSARLAPWVGRGTAGVGLTGTF